MELAFRNVSMRYGDLTALESLSLDVGAGESVAVIGPSGCGKSTLLRLAAGLAVPSSGEVRVGDAAVDGPRREVALILQDYGLLPWKTVFRNAELGLLIRKVPRAQREERTRAALAQVGLAEFARSYPSELSGGMQQRLALARAIALDARVLLMDEPLSALDAFLREELQDLLLDVWTGGAGAAGASPAADSGAAGGAGAAEGAGAHARTHVLVTHSIEEAVYLGQRIVVMAPRPGRVVAQIANPGMGSRDYRASDEFFARCREVRAALAGARDAAVSAAGEGGAR